jgi:hypothetical protein
VIGVSIMLLISAVGGQVGSGLPWLTLARRLLGGFGFGSRRRRGDD